MTQPASISTSEAARRLGVHPDTIVRWADAGRLACWRTPGGQRRFTPADVDALMAESPSEPKGAA